MITVTVLNEKGGVGKTTIAITVAAGLASRGKRVLLIDVDAQGHASRALGLTKHPGLYDLLVRNSDYLDVIQAIPSGKYGGTGESTLYLIGSNVETRHIANSISDAWLVDEKLEPLEELFDFCLIDTAPMPSLLHGAIYLATDFVLYPTLCEFWSFDGLAESLVHRRAVESVKQVKVAGIIPMRVRSNTLEHTENLRSLKERFGNLVWPIIPERIVWAEASTYQVPVFVQAPNSDASGHAWELVDRVEVLANG